MARLDPNCLFVLVDLALQEHLECAQLPQALDLLRMLAGQLGELAVKVELEVGWERVNGVAHHAVHLEAVLVIHAHRFPV